MNNKNKDKDYLHVQVKNELKQQLEKEADEKGLSLNAYVRMILISRAK